MRTIKWLFFGYLTFCVLIAASLGLSFTFTRERDAQTSYGTYGGSLKTLDPAIVGDAGAGDLCGYVYETLYNYAYREDRYRLVPELADGEPIVSPDRLTVDIRIKPGVRFYDPTGAVFPDGTGPEITAEDFIYSWKRVCNFHAGVTSNYAQVFQGRVVGIDAWFDYTHACASEADIDWSRPVEGLQAIDRHTLRIRLTAPFPQLQFTLAMIPTTAVSRDAVRALGDNFRLQPIGTGPYAMQKHLPDQQIVFVANPLYRGGPALPQVKRVQLDCFRETLPPWYLFRAGRLDVNAIPKDTFGQAIAVGTGELSEQMKRDGIGLVKYNSPQVTFIGFNMTDPVVGKNKPLRQAMSLAFDRKRYIDLYLNGRGVVANGPIPPGFPTYEADRVADYQRYDLAAAKAKLAEAETLNGGPIPPMKILFGSTSTNSIQQGDFFVTAMRDLGLTVQADYKPYGAFLGMIDRNQMQIYSLGWVADYPDEQNFWQLYYGKNGGPGGLNATKYDNPEFNSLYEKTAAMSADEERDAIYKRMQQMVLNDCPMMFLYYPVSYQLSHGWVERPWLSDYGHGFKQYVRIDFDARARWPREH